MTKREHLKNAFLLYEMKNSCLCFLVKFAVKNPGLWGAGEKKKVVLLNSFFAEAPAYLIDLMHDKNAEIRKVCDNTLDIIAVGLTFFILTEPLYTRKF